MGSSLLHFLPVSRGTVAPSCSQCYRESVRDALERRVESLEAPECKIVEGEEGNSKKAS